MTEIGLELRRRVLRRVLGSRACPQCGEGRLFRSWARLEERCAACSLVYRREAGSMTGSMYATAVVTEVFAALLVGVAWVFTDWTTPVFLALAIPAVLVFSALVLPVCQAFWVGVEYLTDVANHEPWVRPR